MEKTMTDVLLVESPVKNPMRDRYPWSSPPLILAYTASVLRKNGYEVSAIDLNVGGLNLKRVRNIIEKENPSIVQISTGTEQYLNALQISEAIKKVDPTTKTVLSGSHPTSRPKEVAKESSVDFVIIGEGEYAMLDLTNSILSKKTDFSEVRDLAYREGDEVIMTESSSPLSNVDLPTPARDLFSLEFYEYPGIIRAAWGGCPNNCKFCTVPVYRGNEYRAREPKKIVDEVLEVLKFLPPSTPNVIKFMDDTFSSNKEETLKLSKLFQELDLPIQWEWTFTTRVDVVDEEILREAYRGECSTILVGAESGSQRVLDSLDKDITVNRIREVVDMATDIGLRVNVTFMFPLPEDDRESIRETVGFMKELKGMGANLIMSFTTPYPGTFLYENADDIGINILGSSWDEFDAKHLLIDTKYLSEKELKEIHEDIVEEVGFINQLEV
ncbi:hypothetical protein C9439_00830 [archaeon SCG-AAA382B04]|nr:hypothetical protein C9439_00830 [archaeon SCG-AAA382B04]